MKKLEIDKIIIVLGIIVGILEIYLISCQPPKQKDCTIILKSGTTEISVPCKDSIYYTEFEYEIMNN